MAVVEKLSRSGQQETQVAPYSFQRIGPAGPASLRSLLPFSYFGELPVFALRQDPTFPQPVSLYSDSTLLGHILEQLSVKVVFGLFPHWSYQSFCSLTAFCNLALPTPYGLTLRK